MKKLSAAAALVCALALGSCSDATTVGSWKVDPLSSGTTIAPGGTVRVTDTSGNGHYLFLRDGSTAPVEVVDGGRSGTALQFPSTGRATLEVAGAWPFNPGSDGFQVTVWVSASQTEAGSNGANLVQKGLADGSQWKVQMDDGVPSCRFADTAGKSILWRGANPKPINDGAWYAVTCRKTATQVTIVVQRVGGAEASPQVRNVTLGSITNTAPVTLGSKGTASSPDQFRGRMDNVSFHRF